MSDCKPRMTPVDVDLQMPNRVVNSAESVKAAQELTGALLWLGTRTRPDIGWALHLMTTGVLINAEWTITLGKCVLRYLRGTKGYGLMYRNHEDGYTTGHETSVYDDVRVKRGLAKWSPQPGVILMETFADSSFAPDAQQEDDDEGSDRTTRSTTGLLTYVAGNLVAWRATRQTTTASSTAEAELSGQLSGLHQALSMSAVYSSLGHGSAVLCRCDSQAVMGLIKSHQPLRTRHLSIRAGVLRSAILMGSADVSWCDTNSMIADLLTKSLGRVKFFELRSKLGVQNVTSERQQKAVQQVWLDHEARKTAGDRIQQAKHEEKKGSWEESKGQQAEHQ